MIRLGLNKFYQVKQRRNDQDLSSRTTSVTSFLVAWPWKSHMTYLSLNVVISKMDNSICPNHIVGKIRRFYKLKCHTGVRENYHTFGPRCWEIPALASTLEGLAVHYGGLNMGYILSYICSGFSLSNSVSIAWGLWFPMVELARSQLSVWGVVSPGDRDDDVLFNLYPQHLGTVWHIIGAQQP